MNRLSYHEAYESIFYDANEEAGNRIYLSLYIFHRIECERLINSLEQIESSWCPVRHLDTSPNKIYPEHHALFFDFSEVEKMKDVLRSRGTVSAKRAKILS